MKSSLLDDLRIDSSTSSSPNSSETESEFSSPAHPGAHLVVTHQSMEKPVSSNQSTVSSHHNEGKGRRVFIADSDDEAEVARVSAKSNKKVMQKMAYVSSDDDELNADLQSQKPSDDVPSFLPPESEVSRLEGNDLIEAMSKAVLDYHESEQLTSFTLSPSNRRDETSDIKNVDHHCNNNTNKHSDVFSLPSSDEFKFAVNANSADSTPEQHSALTVEPTKLPEKLSGNEEQIHRSLAVPKKHETTGLKKESPRVPPHSAKPSTNLQHASKLTGKMKMEADQEPQMVREESRGKPVVPRITTTRSPNSSRKETRSPPVPSKETARLPNASCKATKLQDTSYTLQEMYRRAVKHRKHQDEKKQELRNSLEAKVMLNCTFTPKITEKAEAVQRRCNSANGSSKRGAPACFESALKDSEKLRQLHDEKDVDLQECTFVPHIAPASVLLVKRARSATGKVLPTDERLYLDSQRRAIELANSVEVNLRQTLKQAPRRSEAEIKNHISQLHEFQRKREEAMEKLRSEDAALTQYRSTSRDVLIDPAAVVERLLKRPDSSHHADISDHTMKPKVNPISAALARKRRVFLLSEWFHYLCRGAQVLPNTIEFCDNALTTEQLREAGAILTTLRISLFDCKRNGLQVPEFLTENLFVGTLEKYERMHGPQLWSSAGPEAARKRLLEEEGMHRSRGKVLTSKELNDVHTRLYCSHSKQGLSESRDTIFQTSTHLQRQKQQQQLQQCSPSLELRLRVHRDELRELSEVMRSVPNVVGGAPIRDKDSDHEDDDILDTLDRVLRERTQHESTRELLITPPPPEALHVTTLDCASEQKTIDAVSTLSMASLNPDPEDRSAPTCEVGESDLLSECAKLTASSTIATYDRDERKKIELMKRRRLRELGKLMAAAQLGALS